MTWRARLSVPLKPRDHAPLKTLHDARAYMIELPADMASVPQWQRAADLLMRAADGGDAAAIAAATEQVYRALVISLRLDMRAHPIPPL